MKSAGFVIWFRFKSPQSRVVGNKIMDDMELVWSNWQMYWNKKVYDSKPTAELTIGQLRRDIFAKTEAEFEIREIFYNGN